MFPMRQATGLMRSTGVLLYLLSASLLMTGCASRASVSAQWHGNKTPGMPFKSVLIVAHTEDSGSRKSFEEAVAANLRGKNTVAIASSRLMRDYEQITQANLRSLIAANNFDAIIVTHVTRLDVAAVKTGGRTDAIEYTQSTGNPIVPKMRSGTIFQWDYVEHEEPVYTKTEYSTILTTEVYGTVGGEHLYTVVSKSKKQESIAAVIDTLSAAIADKLHADGVVTRN
jgi:hypothetical protein